MPEPIAADPNWELAWPQAMRKVEAERVRRRRARVGVDPDIGPVGFALSGGGIRSATFCLGVFQALAQQRLIRRIDYLSTVSGGGYFGSFLGRLITRGPEPSGGVDAILSPGNTEARIDDKGKLVTIRPLHWLKQNGNYMAPSGGGDILTLLASATRNFVALHLVVASTVLLLMLLLKLLVAGLPQTPGIGALLAAMPSLGITMQGSMPSGWVLSPVIDLLPLPLLLLIAPGWAYWFIEGRVRGELAPVSGFRWLIALLIYLEVTLRLAGWAGYPVIAGLHQTLLAIIGMAVLTDICRYWSLQRCDRDREHDADGAVPTPSWESMRPEPETLIRLAAARSRLTGLFRGLLVTAAVISVIVLIDTLGLTLHATVHQVGPGRFAALAALLAPLALRFGSLKALLGKVMDKPGSRLKLPLQTVAGLLGMAAWGSMLVAMSWLSHALSTGFAADAPAPALDPLAMSVSLVALLGLCGLVGQAWVFLNRSSHATTYASRLTRAFLGASNPARFKSGSRSSITEALRDDDTNMRDYHSQLDVHGGPLHFINVTINQTSAFAGKTIDRNRKGIGMAVGPTSLSAAVAHHALLPAVSATPEDDEIEWRVDVEPLRPNPQRYSMFAHPPATSGAPSRVRVERLTLGQWVGISGAAFSTGLGSQTSLGMSLLLGFANVRLGHWWDSGRDIRYPLRRVLRRLIPVQAHLFDEVTARFHGSDERRWYLSDGGHFENMGAYELIRRRLPLIVIVDGEEDAGYVYEGFANLVRKSRLDFGAEITVLQDATSSVFGSLDQLAPATEGSEAGFSVRRAVMAEVRYQGEPMPSSLLVYLKPTMRREDPVDLREYQVRNRPFPQQPTLDQFFDEAQWESYRKLGEVIGRQVFSSEDCFDRWLKRVNATPA